VQLLYVGDPMCSWCWGFAPVLRRALATYALPLDIVVGGLRPGSAAQPLDGPLRSHLEHHWAQVERVSGQPFNRATLARSGWIYDTELAARAVVTVRRRAPQRTFELFERFQAAFYREAIDLTDPEAYGPLLTAAGLDPEPFVTEMLGDEVGTETYRDFAITQRLGVQGFPTLLLIDGEALRLRLSGYRPYRALAEAFAKVGVPVRDGADPSDREVSP
jgi:putative protein-disulfide isomerase